MVFPLLAPLIGAGASLIGGAMNRKAQREANDKNRPVNQVREWEQAGINPIVGISSGGFIPHQAVSMGDSFAQAGGILAEGLQLQHQEKLKQTEVMKENKRLKEKLDDLSRPRVAGYLPTYGDIIPLPKEGNRNGKSNNGTVSGGGSGTSGDGDGPSLKPRKWAPGREVEIAPVTSGPGLTEIHTPWTGPILVPGADGEPWDLSETTTVLIAGTPQVMKRKFKEGVERYKERQKEAPPGKRADREKKTGDLPDVVWDHLRDTHNRKKTPQNRGDRRY